MSQQNRKTVYLKGYLYWVKVLDAPKPNFDGDAREWTFEFEPDAESMATLTENGLEDRVKDKRSKKNYEDREPFIILRRGEFKVDGDRNDKIRVVDAANEEWNSKTKIGNKTLADVKVQIVDWGPRKKKGIYPLAIRILELVPYVPNEFAPLSEDDPHYKAAKAKNDAFERDFGVTNDDNQESAPEETEEFGETQEQSEQDANESVERDNELDDEVPV